MQTYSLLFYLKKSKGNLEASAIYVRLTVEGKRKEFSTGKMINNKDWNPKTGKVKGNSSQAKSLNLFLDSMRTKIFDSYRDLLIKDKIISIETLQNKVLGIGERQLKLVEVFEDHNQKIEKLIGNGYAKGTWERYETSLRHVQQFMMWKYNISDISLSEITPSFITNFDFFLRTVRLCANNSAVKYVKNLQKIINICLDNEWMTKNPFASYNL
ncbi:phage integrase SAM-like domain and Arm DNA-binding domain-containing protein [Chryseobacterium sp.]|uniref:phage integrase SAM-like domain and Arm DNA-binding domain-containing protein n=1 Tax=Chryseobacterium sp. TaxID=1871047 RepID=UPI0028A1C2EA|nr:phage integrase SAM-like domain and Arm DNA-binding domain-containing protein [Chryseobacterium sp.]